MAEFSIPGLKEAITEVTKLTEVTNKLAKDLLTTAINAEKTMSAFKGNSGLKDYVETTKKASEENSKLEIAKKRLVDAQGNEAKEIAKVNLQIAEQISKNKTLAAAESDNATALQKYNAKILEATKLSKDLGAQMALMALEGKKNTAEYKELEAQFVKASTTSKQLNDSYREMSKTAGDNRALVGSYSSELKGHFDMINSSISSLKGNLASGNWSGSFNDARNVVKGFGEYLSKSKEAAKEFGNEMKTNGGIINSIKDGAKSAGTAIIGFFKPAEQHSAQMVEGLSRIRIGFRQNTEAIIETTVAEEVAADTAKKGSIFTELWAGAQLMFAGATGVATGAVVTLGVALAAIGIGLIIAAVALLIEGLSTFRPLINFIKDGLAGLSAVTAMLSDKILQFVTNIKSVGDLMSKLGDILLHPIDNVKKLGNEMAETAKRGAELNEQTRKLTAAQKDYAIESKNVENQIRTLMLQAKNRTTSEEERIKLLKQAHDLEETMHNKKISMWQQEMDLQLQKLKNEGKITDEEIALLRKGDQAALDHLKLKKIITSSEIDNFREQMTKRADIEGEGIAVREKTNNQADMLADKAQKKREDAAKKAEDNAKKQLDSQRKTAEEAIKTMKITLDNEIATYDQSEKLASENISHVQSIALMKQSIANAEMAKNLIGVKKGSQDEISIRNATKQELIKIENEKVKALEKIQKDGVKFEIELYDLNNKTLIQEGKTLTDLLVNEEKKRIQQSLEIHKKGMRDELNIDKSLSDEKLKQMSKTTGALTANQLKYLQGIQKLEESKDKDIKKLDTDLLNTKVKNINTEVKSEQNKYKLLNKSALAQAKDTFKLEDKRLKDLRKLYKDDAEKIKEIDEEIAANKRLIDKTVSDNKKQLLEEGLNNVIAVFGEESAIGKAAAIAQVTMDTYKSATSAYAGMVEAFPGPWGIAAGVAAAALSVGMGLSNVAKIVGIKMFAEGTTDAPYTGKAIVDEEGAEIHTDASGNIKSFGSDSGAHLTNIVKGDKIIPADISAIIRQTMFSSYGITAQQQQSIDYSKIGEQFGKHANKIVNAVKANKSQMSVLVQKGISDRVIFKGKTV